MGFLVLADYALCLSISFPAACLQHRWLTAARRSQVRVIACIFLRVRSYERTRA